MRGGNREGVIGRRVTERGGTTTLSARARYESGTFFPLALRASQMVRSRSSSGVSLNFNTACWRTGG